MSDVVTSQHNSKCPFCFMVSEGKDVWIESNDSAILVKDKFPVTPGHLLVIPKRHFSSYFDATDEEIKKINSLLKAGKNYLENQFCVDGFNIGINIGRAAGQTIFHLHVHLIPRRKNDVENPAGGIRHVIPGKGFY